MLPIAHHPAVRFWHWESLEQIRVGVLYHQVPSGSLTRALLSPPVALLAVYGAVGRKLHFGRRDGPWVPYDAELRDQNAERLVRERDWPWCWGDEVWMLVRLAGHMTFVHFGEEDDCEVLMASATRPPAVEDAIEALRSWAEQASDQQAHRLAAETLGSFRRT